MSHGFTPFAELLAKLPAWDFNDKILFDAGTGFGELGFYVKVLSGHERVRFQGTPYLIGCDVNPDKVQRAAKFYDESHLWNLTNIPYKFLHGRPDFTFCLEVLEHVSKGKSESLRVLNYLESLSRNLVISVPNGDHRFQARLGPELSHFSRWCAEDFTRRGGYEVYEMDIVGIHGVSRKLYSAYRALRGSPPEHLLAIRNGEG